MGKVIGIDLGTTNSCVAVIEGGKPLVIPSQEGSRTTPSIVAFAKGNQRLVGQLAKRQSVTNAANTIYSIKRFIGRRWEDTEEERQRVPYTCVKGKDNTVNVLVGEKEYTPQEISAMILRKLKNDAEQYLGEEVTQAVITTPAYFTDAQRQATKDAGTIAGLEVLRIINEPTAAALAYGLDKQEQGQNILVFDLGGGTFDVSILQIGDGVFEVKATSGNNHLGGDDLDNIIVRWLLENFQANEGVELTEDKMAIQRLREAAEKAKVELSTIAATSINLPFITADETGPKHLEVEFSRNQFEELAKELVENTLKPLEQAIKDSNLDKSEIGRIVLVGGSTRVPAIQKLIQDFFPNIPLDHSINPDEAVALGAAIQGGVLGGEVEDILLLDVTPLSLGIETFGEVFTKIIDRNVTIPSASSQIFSTASDGQTSVEIHVLQGERAMAEDNKSLGKFLLTGIPPSPKGVPQIEVSFEIDVNGILKVAAQDKGTGKTQTVSISNTGSLDSKEIEKMRLDAEKYAEQDRHRLMLVGLQNQTRNLLESYATTLQENASRIPDQLREEIDKRKDELKLAFESMSYTIEEITQMVNGFREELYKIGIVVYGNQETSGATELGFESIQDELGTEYIDEYVDEYVDLSEHLDESQQKLATIKAEKNIDRQTREMEDKEIMDMEKDILAELDMLPDEELAADVTMDTYFKFNYEEDETVTGDYEAVD